MSETWDWVAEKEFLLSLSAHGVASSEKEKELLRIFKNKITMSKSNNIQYRFSKLTLYFSNQDMHKAQITLIHWTDTYDMS